MRQQLIEKNVKYTLKVESLLNDLSEYTEEAFNAKPSEKSWSAMQTIHHLILSEEMSLAYVQKKLSFKPKLERPGLREWWRIVLLWFYLNLPFRFKAPAAVNEENLPEFASFEDTRRRWLAIRLKWNTFFENADPQTLRVAVYRHPFAGRLSWSGMLSFFSFHTERHKKQIRKALPA